MKAKIGERIVDVWHVAHEENYEPWVQHLFDAQICFWHPKNERQLRFNLLFGGAAQIGDYLVQMAPGDLKVISEKRFHKEYKAIDEM